MLHEIRPVLSCPHALSVTAPQPNNMARRDFELAHEASELVGVLNPVSNTGLHQSRKQTLVHLPVILPTSDRTTTHTKQLRKKPKNLWLCFLPRGVWNVCAAALKAPIRLYQTLLYDPISYYGNSMERTNEIAYRV